MSTSNLLRAIVPTLWSVWLGASKISSKAMATVATTTKPPSRIADAALRHPHVLLMEVTLGEWKDASPAERAWLTIRLMTNLGLDPKKLGSGEARKWLEAKESGGEIFYVQNCPFCGNVMNVTRQVFHHPSDAGCVLDGQGWVRERAKDWNKRV